MTSSLDAINCSTIQESFKDYIIDGKISFSELVKNNISISLEQSSCLDFRHAAIPAGSLDTGVLGSLAPSIERLVGDSPSISDSTNCDLAKIAASSDWNSSLVVGAITLVALGALGIGAAKACFRGSVKDPNKE